MLLLECSLCGEGTRYTQLAQDAAPSSGEDRWVWTCGKCGMVNLLPRHMVSRYRYHGLLPPGAETGPADMPETPAIDTGAKLP